MRIASATLRATLVAGAAATAIAALAAKAPPAPLPAALDLLELPAPATSHGERRLLLDIARAGSRLVAVGEFGLVMLSDDDGRHWTQAAVPTSVMLTALSFVDARRGWAVGHDGVILATRDGGARWVRQFDGNQANAQMLAAAQAEAVRAGPGAQQAQDRLADAEAATQAGPARPLLGVRFIDALTGFAVGAFGQLFETGDGGQHWRYIGNRLPNEGGLHLNGISVTPQGELVIAAEAGTLFRSHDGGRSWARANAGYNGHLFGVVHLAAAGQQVLLAYGFGGHLFRSVDAGATWHAVPSPTTKPIVQGTALGGALVVLAAQDGQLLLSRDAGESFEVLAARPALRKLSAFAPSLQGGFVTVGLGGVAAIDAAWSGVGR